MSVVRRVEEQYKGEVIQFEKVEVWTFDGCRVSWGWHLPSTGDWATKFGTLLEARTSARRMVTGLQREALLAAANEEMGR